MEVCQSLDSTNNIKQQPLTPLRIIRGLICLTVYISTAFMFLVYFVPVIAVLLRLFSVHYSRTAVSYVFGLWLGLWPFLFEKINGTKVIFSGDSVPEKERVLLIANHRTEVDWMYLWDLALRKGCLGHIKYILKSSLMKLPIFGWGFHVLEFIPVERKWEIDEPILSKMLSTFTNRQDPLWLTVFPEGTDFTEKKCERSQKFASENGLPLLKNVLLPKTKGFHACLDGLRFSLDAAEKMKRLLRKYMLEVCRMKIYDLTIAYKRRCPTFLDNVFGVEPCEVHIHVRRIPLDKIPTSEKETANWLMNTFQFKDQLLSDFISNGHFPHQGIEGELSTTKCLVNFAIVIALTLLFTYLTFYSSIWFKVYAALSCIYLASSTYFSIRPFSALDFVKEVFFRCKTA